jgi:pyruvate/2-oxoglutarate dehydrogenase complex dihydrolipoamide acyltransferase (E2) component
MASEDPALEDDGRMSGDEGYAERAERAGRDHGESAGDPDLQLEVPALSVEEIDLEVEDLQVHLSIQAELADLVKIKVGLDAELGGVKLGIKGVEAQAQLKARLDNVRAIFSEVLASLRYNPQFFREPVGTEAADGTGDVSVQSANEDAEHPEEPEATEAAARKARKLGVDLSGLEGTGAGGRIVVRDVTRAADG